MSNSDNRISQGLHKNEKSSGGDDRFTKEELFVHEDNLDMDLIEDLRDPFGIEDTERVIEMAFMCASYMESDSGEDYYEMGNPDNFKDIIKKSEKKEDLKEIYVIEVPRWQLLVLAEKINDVKERYENFELFVEKILKVCKDSLKAII